MEVVNRHNYEPNANAKHLKQQANDGIVLIVKGIQNMLFAGILEQLQSEIANRGYVPTVYYIDEEANEVAQAAYLRRAQALRHYVSGLQP